METSLSEDDFLACCGSTKFAKEMASLPNVLSIDNAIDAARDVWFNKVDVCGWLEAFAAHPQIGQSSLFINEPQLIAQKWSKRGQETAIETTRSSSLQELFDWNVRYMKKFGFIFLICAMEWNTTEILVELKKRFLNRPIIEFEVAAMEQMKIIELRLTCLFSTKRNFSSMCDQHSTVHTKQTEGIIGRDFTANTDSHMGSPVSGFPLGNAPASMIRIHPPITTHVLDVSCGRPVADVEVRLDMWHGMDSHSLFSMSCFCDYWELKGSSTTDIDGRCGRLMDIVDKVKPGIYRLTFNTVHYNPAGFFPYVSVVFEVLESQGHEHFHVPLLLSPFSFTTYRGN